MTFFVEESKPSNSCSLLSSAVKEALAQCHIFPNERGSCSSSEDENPDSEIEDERVIILAVRNRMTKGRLGRKNRLRTKSLSWAFSPSTGELYVAPKAFEEKLTKKEKVREEKETQVEDDADDADDADDEEEETESFFSVRSRFSRSSSASRVDDGDGQLRRRSVLEKFSHCEGWPFGLYRKSLMLPPLPSSPSESWTWCRRRGMLKPLQY